MYLACRSESRTLEAIKRLEEEVPDVKGMDRLKFLKVDLGDAHDVQRAGEEFLKREGRLDVLGESCLQTCISQRR